MIRWIVGGRRTGKTTRLLRWMQEAPPGEHRVIVSHTLDESNRLRKLAKDSGIDVESWQFVTANEVAHTDRSMWSGVLFGRGGQMSLGLDNLDLTLRHLVGWPVGAASLSVGENFELLGNPDGHSPVCAFMLQRVPGEAECDCGFNARVRKHALMWLETDEAKKMLAEARAAVIGSHGHGPSSHPHPCERCEQEARAMLNDMTEDTRLIKVEDL